MMQPTCVFQQPLKELELWNRRVQEMVILVATVCVSGGVASANGSIHKHLCRALLSARSVIRFLTVQVCQPGFSLCLTTIANWQNVVRLVEMVPHAADLNFKLNERTFYIYCWSSLLPAGNSGCLLSHKYWQSHVLCVHHTHIMTTYLKDRFTPVYVSDMLCRKTQSGLLFSFRALVFSDHSLSLSSAITQQILASFSPFQQHLLGE